MIYLKLLTFVELRSEKNRVICWYIKMRFFFFGIKKNVNKALHELAQVIRFSELVWWVLIVK